jgi:hypothetical protein
MGRSSKGEDCLIKNMTGNNDVVGGDIETPIAFVISRVSNDFTMSGPGDQFVGSLCGEVGIVNTTEHMQVVI